MATKTATTNAQGKATLEGLVAGKHNITIEKEGYETKTVEITVVDDKTSIDAITLTATQSPAPQGEGTE